MINKRGWIVQELCLSDRVIHFVEDQIIWECNHETCSEELLRPPSVDIFRSRIGSIFDSWREFVKQYSTCELTDPNDKLHAISGIASVWLQTAHSSDRYCGIFDRDIGRSLLWFMATHKVNEITRRPHRAPTWSWASYDGPIGFVEPLERVSGRLVLEAEMCGFKCQCNNPTGSHFTCKSCVIRLKVKLRNSLKIGEPTWPKRFNTMPRQRGWLDTIYYNSQCVGWVDFDIGHADYRELCCLRVASQSIKPGVLSNRRTHGYYVIIAKRQMGQYVRVGIGYIFRPDLYSNWITEVVELI